MKTLKLKRLQPETQTQDIKARNNNHHSEYPILTVKQISKD